MLPTSCSFQGSYLRHCEYTNHARSRSLVQERYLFSGVRVIEKVRRKRATQVTLNTCYIRSQHWRYKYISPDQELCVNGKQLRFIWKFKEQSADGWCTKGRGVGKKSVLMRSVNDGEWKKVPGHDTPNMATENIESLWRFVMHSPRCPIYMALVRWIL